MSKQLFPVSPGSDDLEKGWKRVSRSTASHNTSMKSRCPMAVGCAPPMANRLGGRVHVDISDRKKLEHELMASRIYLSQVMDTNVAAVAVLTSVGVLSFANREAERVLGLKRSEIIGRTYHDPAWRIERTTGGSCRMRSCFSGRQWLQENRCGMSNSHCTGRTVRAESCLATRLR